MKKAGIIIFVILFLLAIPLTVYLVFKNQELRKKAAPATTLKFVPQNIHKKVGDEFSLEAQIDTADNEVVAAEINILYDPTKLEAISITNGSLFPNILSSGTIDNGLASISVGATNTTSPITGSGTAAIIKFKALAPTTSPISVRFDPNTFVGALGEQGNNVLVSSIPATVTITGDAIITNTPTPTIQPSPTLMTQNTPTPTIIVPTSAPSTIIITNPSSNELVSTNQPTIEGKSSPGATITLTIYSEPITATVTSDTSGNWSYNINQPLTDGPHTIVASSLTTSGQTQTATLEFVVASGNIPASGSVLTLFIPVAFGIVLLFSGILLL